MTSLKLHYDGWLALPVNIRRQLGLGTGDELFAEIVDGGIMLRLDGKASVEQEEEPEPAKTAMTKAIPAAAKAEAAPIPAAAKKAAKPEPEPEPEPAPKKKAAAADGPAATVKLPVTTVLKARGRRKATGSSDNPSARN